ncbi:hypothetical protein HanXRQr2_Chr04g0183361 [Helianthus annuus]|uniref:Uncharacterized protein n=1 Tax=Helianthus annuus TaxID=4232 RepID=A0A9K3NTQ6_HELAN|nr:hypothetical protein HanXRQr2_Chr04g0183361 [Helianthus annuus]
MENGFLQQPNEHFSCIKGFSKSDLGSRGRTRRDSHPLREISPIIPAVIPCFFIGAHRIKI